MKKWIYAIGLTAFGFVIFNNVVQTATIIKGNSHLITGLLIAIISSLFYGVINIKE
ncbi:MAG TPA: hypothetical protein VGB37_14550 [Candidatus Lokiarchaeia archaeon]